jgi:hypothetical protein
MHSVLSVPSIINRQRLIVSCRAAQAAVQQQPPAVHLLCGCHSAHMLNPQTHGYMMLLDD